MRGIGMLVRIRRAGHVNPEEERKMAVFEIEPDRRTLHGAFSREAEPILMIDSGDTVCYRILDAGWGLERPIGPGQPGQKFSPRIEERDNGHALCGPVAIRGAQPGMVLEIHIV